MRNEAWTASNITGANRVAEDWYTFSVPDGIRDKTLDELRARFPEVSDATYFRTDAQNIEVYGETAWRNEWENIRSEGVRAQTDGVMAAYEAARAAGNEEEFSDHPVIRMMHYFTEWRQRLKEKNTPLAAAKKSLVHEIASADKATSLAKKILEAADSGASLEGFRKSSLLATLIPEVDDPAVISDEAMLAQVAGLVEDKPREKSALASTLGGVEDRLDQLVAEKQARFRELYANGFMSFARYRENLLGEDKLKPAEKAVKEAIAEYNGPNVSQNIMSRATGIIQGVVRSRLKSILMATDDELHLAEFVVDVSRKLGLLVGSLLSDTALDRPNAEQAVQICNEYLNKILYPNYLLEYSIGIGGSEDPVSIRQPSYLIPALKQMQKFAELGIKPPQLRVFHAYQLSAHVNDLDLTIAGTRALESVQFMEGFVEKFFPELRGHVSFEMPNLVEIQRPTYHEDHRFLESVVDHDDGSEDEGHRLLKKALRALMTRGAKHAAGVADPEADFVGADAALTYSAAHPGEGAFGDVRSVNSIGTPLGVDGTIKFGGSGEIHFNLVQSVLAGRHITQTRESRTYLPNTAGGDMEFGGQKYRGSSSGRPVHTAIVQKIGGNPPPYYLAGENEYTLDSNETTSMEALIARYEADPELVGSVADLRLLADTVGGDNYISFVTSVKERLRKSGSNVDA